MPELLRIKTKDGLTLPGLLYSPPRPTNRAVIYLHGMGSSVFYQMLIEPVSSELVKAGVAFYAFNNRGSEYVKNLKVFKNGKKVRVKAGMSFEKIKDCIKDIDAAVDLLKKNGYTELYLAGHSTGANKVCVYNYYKKTGNPFKKYILLGGGDDTGLFYQDLGAAKYQELLKLSRQKIKNKKGEELIPGTVFEGEIFSYQSMNEILDPDQDYNVFPFAEAMGRIPAISTKPLFRHYLSIRKPTLVVYGSDDEYCYGQVDKCVDILRLVNSKTEFKFEILAKADHSFYPYESKLAKLMAKNL